jgi:glycerol transport system permease protein
MFSWVELLLARTLTSVNAKPIVATMTRTISSARAWTGRRWPQPAC